MNTRPRHRSTRPADVPVHISPTGMDFEKRRLLITQVAGSTIQSMISSISNAIVRYEDTTISHEDKVVYQL